MPSVEMGTRYLGLTLHSPVIASASPLTGRLSTLQEIEEQGAGAVVLPSLFEEQVEHVQLETFHLYESQAEAFPEAASFLPELHDYNTGPEGYLELIRAAKRHLKIPVIASLNGSSTSGWTDFARRIVDVGADAIELNIYHIPQNVAETSHDVERRYVDVVTMVKKVATVPVAVKIGPFFSSLPAVAGQLSDAGADALVLFNRYLEPDLNLAQLIYEPGLVLSRQYDFRLPLRWIALLRDQLSVDLAATSGVTNAEDVVKLLMAGANAVQVAAVIMQRGVSFLRELVEQVKAWLEENEYASVEQLQGSMSRTKCPNPDGLLRANYLQTLYSYTDKSF